MMQPRDRQHVPTSSRKAYGLRWWSLILTMALLLGSLPASAAESGPVLRVKTIYLLLLSSGKGDGGVVPVLRTSLESTERIKVTDEPGGADFIGKLEIQRNLDGQEVVLTVMARGGDTLLRSAQKVRKGNTLQDATDAIAWEVLTVAVNGRGRRLEATPKQDVPAPKAARRDAWEEDTTDDGPGRLSFVFGLDIGGGPWFANPSNIMKGTPTGFDFSRYAPAFTWALDGRWRGMLDIHGGWRFLRAGSFEVAAQTSAWGNNGLGAGGAIFVGPRLMGFPLEAFLKDRKYEVGLELGGGYTFVGGPYYNMSGKYLSFGITGEYPIKPWLSLQANYRMFMSFLGKFYVDYANDIVEPVDGFKAYWHTFTVGAVIHIQTRL